MARPQGLNDLEQIIAAGDRVAFKAYLQWASDAELVLAWTKAARANVQDFSQLARQELIVRQAK